jgi:hypothetical protein
VTTKLNEHGGPLKRLERLFRKEKTVMMLIMAYLISITVWALLRILRNYGTIVFGGMRALYGFETIRNCFHLLPFVINCFFLDMFQTFAAMLKFERKTEQAAPHLLISSPSSGTGKKVSKLHSSKGDLHAEGEDSSKGKKWRRPSAFRTFRRLTLNLLNHRKRAILRRMLTQRRLCWFLLLVDQAMLIPI